MVSFFLLHFITVAITLTYILGGVSVFKHIFVGCQTLFGCHVWDIAKDLVPEIDIQLSLLVFHISQSTEYLK